MSKSPFGFLFLAFLATSLFALSAQGAAPVITSGTAATADLGYAFAYQITATDSPTLYGATGLPPGLALDGGAGLISGTPSQSGTFNCNISATNADGTGSAQLTLLVRPGATTVSWTGSVSSDWFDARNWDTQFVPRSVDHVAISSGTVAASPSATFASLTFSGGTISGTLTVPNGSMDWMGGTLQGTLNVSGSLSLLASYASSPTLNGTLNNTGVVTTGSYLSSTPTLYLGANSQINNQGLFRLDNSYGLSIWGATGSAFSNTGTLRCNMNGGSIQLTSIRFTNTGLVDIQSGYFASDIGFSNSGTMTTGPVQYPGSGGTIALSGTITGTLTASNNYLSNNDVAGDFSVTGSLTWAGSKISGNVSVANGGAISISANLGNAPTLTGSLNNSGTITTGSNQSATPTLILGPHGQIKNLSGGLFLLSDSHGLNLTGTAGASFSNAGTLRCNAGGGSVQLRTVLFTNTGLVDVQSGLFSSDIGFANFGTMTTAPFQFPGSGGTIALSGTIAGTLTASNNYLSNNDVFGDFSVTGTVNWAGSKISGNVTVAQGGALSISANSGNAPTLTGTLNNNGAITTGSNQSSTPTLMLGAQGQINNLSNGLFLLADSHGLNLTGTNGSSFSNAGTLRCNPGVSACLLTSILFTNTGLVDIQSGYFASDIGFANYGIMTTAPFQYPSSGGTVVLAGTIAGTLTASNNYASNNDLAGDFSVTGTVNWAGGKVSGNVSIAPGGVISIAGNGPSLTGTLNNSGTITSGSNLSATPTLLLGAKGQINNLAGGLFLLTDSHALNLTGTTGASFSNAGTLRCNLSGGALILTNILFTNTGLVDIQSGYFASDIGFANYGSMTTAPFQFPYGGGTIELCGTIVGTLTASNNYLSGNDIDGDFSLTGTLNWMSGKIASNIAIAPGGSLSINANSWNSPNLTGTLNNSGTITTGSNQSATPTLFLGAKAQINNLLNGFFLLTESHGLNLSGSNGASFANTGTLRCNMSSGALELTNILFTNTGLVDIQSGYFASDIGFANYGAMTTAPFQYPSSGGTIALAGTISGTLTASNNYLSNNDVAGNFSLSGTLNWMSNQLTGNVTVAPGGVISINASSGNPPTLTGTLNNNGTVATPSYSYSTPELDLGPQARFNNLPGGLFCPLGTSGMTLGGWPGSAFANAGTFRCAVGYQTLLLSGIAFTNSGWIDLQSGTLSFDNAFAQTSGTLSLSGTGGLQSSQSMQISGGAIAGSGLINANLVNSGGIIRPGTPIGSLTIQGSYTQSGTGLIDLEISGTTPQTGFDQFIITGPANLGGSLKAAFINGFQPAADQSFALLSYGSIGSNTLTFDLPSLSGGLTYTKTFSSAQFTLSLSASPFTNWKQQKFGADANNPSVSGDQVIHNPAGLTNLMAYALGVDPFTATAADLPVSELKTQDGSKYLSYTFHRDTTATDLTYTIEASGDLNAPDNWTLLAQSINGAPTQGPGLVAETGSNSIVSVEVRDTQAVDSAAHRFIRLKVTH